MKKRRRRCKMVTIDDITKYITPVLPYAQMIIVFIIPIYIIIGEPLANLCLAFIGILPSPTVTTWLQWLPLIIAIVIGILGLILGITTDPERETDD
jgi:hypothetical protein